MKSEREFGGSVQAAMKLLGEFNGQPYYWADPRAGFTKPGLYYWDGKRNVCAYELGLSASVPGEAVAWRSRMPEDSRWLVTEHEPTVPGITKEPLYTHPAVSASVVTEEMVQRFLAWPLPDSVCPDRATNDPGRLIDGKYRPLTGTNLLTAAEAQAMLRHVLDGLPVPRTFADALAIANDPKLRAKP